MMEIDNLRASEEILDGVWTYPSCPRYPHLAIHITVTSVIRMAVILGLVN